MPRDQPRSADQAASEPGNNPSKGCSHADFARHAEQDRAAADLRRRAGGTGSNAWYHVYGYAAFTITGYYFAGQYSPNQPCSGSDRCISGYFTRFVDLGDACTYSATGPDLGADILRLIR